MEKNTGEEKISKRKMHIVGFSPHRKLMVGEHNIMVGAVLTHQASLLG
jgi:hypothetical protein